MKKTLAMLIAALLWLLTAEGSEAAGQSCDSPGTTLFSVGCLPSFEDLHRPRAGSTIDTPPRIGWRSDGRPYWRRNLFKRLLNDQAFLIQSWWPSEGRRLDFSVPVVLALAGAAGSRSPSSLDRQMQRSFQAWTERGPRDALKWVSELGETEAALALVGSSYFIARWSRNGRLERATSLTAEALLNTALYTTVLKRATRRTRPLGGGTGEFFVNQPADGHQPSSFPSGHASGAFAVATVLASEYRDRRWVPWVAYGTAGLIAVSRVGLGHHFPSDILAGAALGHSLGRMVVHRNREATDDRVLFRFEPLVDPVSGGVGVSYRRSW